MQDALPKTERKRYRNNCDQNLIKFYIPLCDNWMVFDNSISHYKLFAEGLQGNIISVYNQTTWAEINGRAND